MLCFFSVTRIGVKMFRKHSFYRRTNISSGIHLNNRFNNKRAFSLIELAISLGIFMLASAAITIAIGNAGVAGGEIRLEKNVKYQVQSLATQISQANYSTLITNTFTRPSACADDEMKSCITLNDQSFVITWEINSGTDVNSVLVDAPGTIKIIGSLTLVSGKTISAFATARAPAGNWSASDYSAVRVSISNPAGYSGPIYLYSAKNGVATVIAASNPIGTSKKVVLRYITNNCGPCRLSLTATGSNLLDTYMLDQATSSTYGYTLSTGTGLNDTNAVIRNATKVTLNLWAHNTDGTYLPPASSTGGSICLYLSYTEGDSTYKIPGCNTTSNPSQIVYQSITLQTGITNGNYVTGIPAGVPLTFSTDGVTAGSTCTDPSTLGAGSFSSTYYNGSAFTSGIECTSWTWGYPKWLNTAGPLYSSTGSKTFENGSYTTPASSSDVELGVTWDTSISAPAGGVNSGDTLWGKPRTKRTTITSLTTEQLAASDSSCGGSFCNSLLNYLPYPTTGRFATPLGPQWGVVYAGNGTISLSITDNDFSSSYPISATLGSQTVNGSLYQDLARTILYSPGSSLLSSCTTLPCTINLYYSSTSALDYFNLTLTQNGSSRTYNIGLAPSAGSIWGVVPSSVTLTQKQNSSKYYLLNSYNFSGALTGGVNFTTSTSGVQLTAPAATVSSTTAASGICPSLLTGQACIQVSALATTLPNTYSINNYTSSGIYSALVNSTVSQKPATLSVISATSGNQGDTITIIGEIKDANATAVTNAPIFLSSVYSGSGTWTPGVKASVVSCATESNGRCTLTLSMQKGAPSGTYNFTLTSGALSASSTFTVSKVADRISINSSEVSQSSSVAIPLHIYDASGIGVSGITPTISALSGFTSSFSGATDSNGLSTLNLAATASATVGRHDFTITAGSLTQLLRVNVTCVAKGISTITPSVAQGANTQLSFYALDTNGDHCPYAELTVTNASTLLVSKNLQADKNGLIKTNVTAPLSTGTGIYSLTLSNNIPNTISTLNVVVTVGLSYLSPQKIIAKGNSQVITFDVRDSVGGLIANLPFTVKSLAPELTITGAINGIYSSTSASSGYITLTLNTPSTIRSGYYDLMFTINGKNYQVSVAVR